MATSNFGSEQLLSLIETYSIDVIAKQGITFAQDNINFKLDEKDLCYAVILALQARATARWQPISFVVRKFCANRSERMPPGAAENECEIMLHGMFTDLVAAQPKRKSVKFVKPYSKRSNAEGERPEEDSSSDCQEQAAPVETKRSLRTRTEKQLHPFAAAKAQHKQQVRKRRAVGSRSKAKRVVPKKKKKVTKSLLSPLAAPASLNGLDTSSNGNEAVAAAGILFGMASASQQTSVALSDACTTLAPEGALGAASVLFGMANASQQDDVMLGVATFRAW